MINSALRAARVNRLSAFLRDTEAFYKAMTAGNPTKSRVSKLKNYSLSLTAAKSDEVLRPLAEACEQLLDELTDGRSYAEKQEKIDAIWSVIGREVLSIEFPVK